MTSMIRCKVYLFKEKSVVWVQSHLYFPKLLGSSEPILQNFFFNLIKVVSYNAYRNSII